MTYASHRISAFCEHKSHLKWLKCAQISDNRVSSKELAGSSHEFCSHLALSLGTMQRFLTFTKIVATRLIMFLIIRIFESAGDPRVSSSGASHETTRSRCRYWRSWSNWL
jgi:hypothetical protein